MVGLIAGIHQLSKYCEEAHINEGDGMGGCDGEGTILIGKESYDIIKTSRKHFDVIHALHQEIRRCPIRLRLKHIEGHKDDIALYSTLSREEQLNVQADRAAKAHMDRIKQQKSSHTTHMDLPYSSCAIYIHNDSKWTRLSSTLHNTLTHLIEGNKIKEYWEAKGKLGELSRDEIDWYMMEKSHRTQKHPSNKWICKFRTGFCGIGKK